jgi:hypothetical protein
MLIKAGYMQNHDRSVTLKYFQTPEWGIGRLCHAISQTELTKLPLDTTFAEYNYSNP